jgi:hypothetical protein
VSDSRLERVLLGLPGLRLLEESNSVQGGFWLSAGGVSAFGGALRLFPCSEGREIPSVNQWNVEDGWRAAFGTLAPKWLSVGEDAFGTQYLLSPDQSEMALFWPETGEVEALQVSPHEFLSMIAKNPDNTVSLSLYEACCARFGPLALGRHFAFKVETALGGKAELGNVSPMDALEHMVALGKIATQIGNAEIGTAFLPERGPVPK